MTQKTSALLCVIGLVITAATALLPIDHNAVFINTVEKMARTSVSALAKGKLEVPVRVEYSGDSRAEPVVEAVIFAKTARAPKGDAWVGRFIRSEGAQARTLTVNAQAIDGVATLKMSLGDTSESATARLGDWMALIPPLLALVIAVAYRKVVWALLLAVLAGGVIMHGSLFGSLWIEIVAIFGALPKLLGFSGPAVDGYLGQVLAETFNLQILGFTFALVGMVGVIGRMGGTRGLVDALSKFAVGPRSAQAVTSAMGTAVFFDDYANTVVVGTTARSLTDRHRISREKLAYIVDSTSAPVAGIAIISTWIGYEVGLFDDLLSTLAGVPGVPGSGYELFFEILPLRFYCIFALALVFLNAWSGRDLGPMYRAEARVRAGGPVVPPDVEHEAESNDEEVPDAIEKPGIPYRALNAIVPIGAVLGLTLGWIVYIGTQAGSVSLATLAGWKSVFDAASDHIGTILLMSALFGSVVAILLSLIQGLLSLKECASAYLGGLKTLAEAAAILVLAWAIKEVCSDLGTGMTLVALVGDSLPGLILPLVIFILSGIVAFSTGTSWGTMALVLPIAAPLSVSLSGDTLIVLACMGAVLDGAIWGDHCSPISDTTILSSTATGCPHLAHVKTQIPYATLAMVASGLAGYFGVAAGLPIGVAYLGGILILVGGLFMFGRKTPARSDGGGSVQGDDPEHEATSTSDAPAAVTV